MLVRSGSLPNALLLGDPNANTILVKFTRVNGMDTRIDLINGTTYLLSKDQVNNDIKRLVGLMGGSR